LLNRELGDHKSKCSELEEELNASVERAERFERDYHTEAVHNKALSDMMWKEKEESRNLRGQVSQLEAVKRDLDDKLSR
jgi:chromosome segregation ATPase